MSVQRLKEFKFSLKRMEKEITDLIKFIVNKYCQTIHKKISKLKNIQVILKIMLGFK